MSRQVDVASGGLCERKEFSRRILPLRSAKRLLERAPSIYYGLGYAFLLGIVHRMLPWRLATQALDSTVIFLNTTDCRTGRRARQPRPAQIPTSWRFAGVLPAAREESQRLSEADFPDPDFRKVRGCTSTSRAFYVKLTLNRPTPGWPVTRAKSSASVHGTKHFR